MVMDISKVDCRPMGDVTLSLLPFILIRTVESNGSVEIVPTQTVD